MISEEQQDQAALYALGLLGADEDAAFESELRANAELRDLDPRAARGGRRPRPNRSIAAAACIVKAAHHG